MAEARSNTQLPIGGVAAKSVIEEEIEAFQQGIEIGRKYADVGRRKVAAWAEEHPGQLILAGLAWLLGVGIISLLLWLSGTVFTDGLLQTVVTLLALLLGVLGWRRKQKTKKNSG